MDSNPINTTNSSTNSKEVSKTFLDIMDGNIPIKIRAK